MTGTRLLSTWLLLAVLMPVNGMLREFGFKRLMSDAASEALSVVTGRAVVLATTRWLFRIPADTPNSRLLLWSVILVALTIAYEFGIGHLGSGAVGEDTVHLT